MVETVIEKTVLAAGALEPDSRTVDRQKTR